MLTNRTVLALGLVGLAAGLVSLATPTVLNRVLSARRIYPPESVPARDVALVFGAQVYPGGRPSRYLRARLELAAQLYADGKAHVLIVSGDGRAEHYSEPTSMRDYLVAAGVPAAAIVRDPAGFDTYDSCVRARRVYGVASLITVSQAYHLPRIIATARLVGLDAVGVADTMIDRRNPTWRQGAAREIFAAHKMVWDLVSRRRPILGPATDAVQQAVAGRVTRRSG